MIEYTRKIVAFIDVLGFKEHISKTVESSEYLGLINRALEVFSQEVHNNYENTYPLSELGKEVTNFSDSFVISYNFEHKSALFYVIMDLIHIQITLAHYGILVRGSVTIGDIFHDRDKIFGPALIEAYNLESKSAIYPRIILTEETLIKGIRNPVDHHTPKMELEYLSTVLKEDKDIYLYIDYIKQYEEFDFPDDYYTFLKNLKDLIENNLYNTQTEEKVKKKYRWLKKKYNIAVREYSDEVKEGYKRRFKRDFLLY